jgi:hypothetical protein
MTADNSVRQFATAFGLMPINAKAKLSITLLLLLGPCEPDAAVTLSIPYRFLRVWLKGRTIKP